MRTHLSRLCSTFLTSLRSHWPFYAFLLLVVVLCQVITNERWGNAGRLLKAIQDAHEAGEAARTEDYVRYILPRTARFISYFCGALIVVGPWLIGKRTAAPATELSAREKRQRKWLWTITGIVILSSAALNAPRLSQSLWTDEEWTLRLNAVGEFRQTEGGELKWAPATWMKAFFYYHTPNNHPLLSVLAKFSHSFWKTPEDKAAFYFSETALRLPAFLFGLGGLATLAWLASTLGRPVAGIIAVIWLSLHPWHVRYGIDARGYALLFTFLPLCLTFLWKAVTTGQLRWWMSYGIAQFLALWSYPGSLYFMVTMNAAACGIIAFTKMPVSRWLQWRRYATANMIGAMLTTLALAPCISPAKFYLKSPRMKGEMTLEGLVNTFSGMFTGITWTKWGLNPEALSWLRTWDHTAWFVVLVFAMLAALFFIGVAVLIRSDSQHRWFLIALLLPAPFMVTAAAVQHNILYFWYVIIGLPGLALLIGCGTETLMHRFHQTRSSTIAGAAVLLIFASATWAQNHLLRSRDPEQMRQSVLATRTEVNPLTGDLGKVLTAGLAHTARCYDPAALILRNTDDLKMLMAKAVEKKLPLFVNLGDRHIARSQNPETVKLLESPALFEELPIFYGLQGQHERVVFRYRASTPPP